MNIPVRVIRLPHAADLPLPSYATVGAAGMDLMAAVDGRMTIYVNKLGIVPTGLSVALPPGYELQIRPRSGLAMRQQIIMANSPGTIDEDYRGEIKLLLFNAGSYPFVINRGDRVAQAVLSPVVRAQWVEVAELDETDRGAGGFGSTGIAQAA